jgi:hypothetical protein
LQLGGGLLMVWRRWGAGDWRPPLPPTHC